MAVKRTSQEEKAIVNSRLRKKYPQMQTKEWKDAVAKAGKARANANPDPAKLSESEKSRYAKKKQRRETAMGKVKAAGEARDNSLKEALTGEEYRRLVGR